MNDLVTVVVPVYNVEKYLDRCILSIVGQTYQNLEIILVDDGSTDNCPQICDEYAVGDARIKVIHKKNEGLGMSRNTGIEHATGKYICFFDSDDYVEPNTIEVCVAAATANNADMVVFGYDDVTPDGRTLASYIPCPAKQFFSDSEIITTLLPMSLCTNLRTGEDWQTPLSACTKLYLLSVIRKSDWRFVSERDIISEDFYSLTELHAHLSKVYILNRVFYHYTVNNASLSRSFKPNRFERIKIFYNAMLSLSEQMKIRDVLEQPIKGIVFGFVIGAMKQIVDADLGFCKCYGELKKIIKDDCMQKLVRTTDYRGSNFQKKLLYSAVKYKQVWLCYLLVYLKNKRTACR